MKIILLFIFAVSIPTTNVLAWHCGDYIDCIYLKYKASQDQEQVKQIEKLGK